MALSIESAPKRLIGRVSPAGVTAAGVLAAVGAVAKVLVQKISEADSESLVNAWRQLVDAWRQLVDVWGQSSGVVQVALIVAVTVILVALIRPWRGDRG